MLIECYWMLALLFQYYLSNIELLLYQMAI
jgi:hypothetical protein